MSKKYTPEKMFLGKATEKCDPVSTTSEHFCNQNIMDSGFLHKNLHKYWVVHTSRDEIVCTCACRT